MRIKIITNSGFKYTGEKISDSKIYIKMRDERQGIIEIPYVNISFIKNLEELE